MGVLAQRLVNWAERFHLTVISEEEPWTHYCYRGFNCIKNPLGIESANP